MIVSLSFAKLDYPDGSRHFVWLPDATIPYLKGKHLVLFTIAMIIIILGAIYTTLLFTWQWLLIHQDKKIFRWTKHQKLCHFIEPYHAPYVFEQRYWIGLLLLIRVVLYIISAVNLTGDPRVSLVSTAIIVGSLPALKGILERKIYKKWWIEVTELLTYINIVAFAALTLYTFDGNNNQAIIAYISVLITFALLSGVVVYHAIHYTGLLSTLKKIRARYVTHKINSCCQHGQMGSCTVSAQEYNRPLITETVVEFSTAIELESVVKD